MSYKKLYCNRLTLKAAIPLNIKSEYYYCLLLIVPYLLSQFIHLTPKGWYQEILSFLWILGMTALFVQFALGGRISKGKLFSKIDWSMSKHKKVGKLLGTLFLLHPFIIIAPRFLVSWEDGVTSAISMVTSPSLLTGLIAWGVLIVFVLLSVYKRSIPLRYEAWRFLHLIAFSAMAILATLHVTSIGRHSQFQPAFSLLWWGICAAVLTVVIYNHLIKPLKLKQIPFRLKSVTKVSSSDWQLTLEKPEDMGFDFSPGQFVWINSSSSTFNMSDHPFSIASGRKDLPNVSFIIRTLGDYTNTLWQLKPGQKVYLDGPYGSMSLQDSQQAEGILLVAGGAGIGPMLSLLRGLEAQQERRPVRLIYGNRSLNQMVLQEDIQGLEQSMSNFRQLRACTEEAGPDIYTGVIDRTLLEQSLDHGKRENWVAYICGPPDMVKAVSRDACALGIPRQQIHYEQLSF